MIEEAQTYERTGDQVIFTGSVFSPDPIEQGAIDLFKLANEADSHFRVLYHPGMDADNPYTRLAAAIDAGTEEQFYADYPWDVRPVADDSPFFFNFYHWSDLWEGEGKMDWADLTGGPGILGALLLQTTVLVALLVILPLFFLRGGGIRSARNAGRHLAYFLALGAGFMFLEISTIQRLVLYLGHPTYSLTVTLFCFLFFAGLGSLYARRFHADRASALRRVVPLLALGLVILTVLLEVVPDATLHLELPVRIAITVLLLAPVNFLMGMPFPVGLERLKELEPRLVPWALGANGGASVVGSILCIVLAMEAGFRAVSLLSVVVYLGGTWLFTSGR